MDCAALPSLLPHLVTGTLSGAAAERLERHVQTCTRCRERVERAKGRLRTKTDRVPAFETTPLRSSEPELDPVSEPGRTVAGDGGTLAYGSDTGETDDEPGPGTVLGHYVIIDELARGGMGIVYRANQDVVNRVVALKVLPANALDDEELVTRFIREARAAAELNHPNVVRIYDIGRDGGHTWFSMELVPGKSLKKVIEEEGRLSPRRALDVAIACARALEAAEAARIVHRDVKPDNLLITPDGHVKLADLGLVRRIRPLAATNTLTQEGDILGTPAYMSPEQARDSRLADSRSDLWSLGATLYHALFGVPPFVGRTPLDTVSLVLSSEVKFPPEHDALPPQAKAALAKLLQKSPEERYQTATAAREALEKARAELELRRSSGEKLRGARDTRRSRRPTSSAEHVAARRASSDAHAPAARRRRSHRRTRSLLPLAAGALSLIGVAVVIGLARRAPPTIAATGTNDASPVTAPVATASVAATPGARPVAASEPLASPFVRKIDEQLARLESSPAPLGAIAAALGALEPRGADDRARRDDALARVEERATRELVALGEPPDLEKLAELARRCEGLAAGDRARALLATLADERRARLDEAARRDLATRRAELAQLEKLARSLDADELARGAARALDLAPRLASDEAARARTLGSALLARAHDVALVRSDALCTAALARALEGLRRWPIPFEAVRRACASELAPLDPALASDVAAHLSRVDGLVARARRGLALDGPEELGLRTGGSVRGRFVVDDQGLFFDAGIGHRFPQDLTVDALRRCAHRAPRETGETRDAIERGVASLALVVGDLVEAARRRSSLEPSPLLALLLRHEARCRGLHLVAADLAWEAGHRGPALRHYALAAAEPDLLEPEARKRATERLKPPPRVKPSAREGDVLDLRSSESHAWTPADWEALPLAADAPPLESVLPALEATQGPDGVSFSGFGRRVLRRAFAGDATFDVAAKLEKGAGLGLTFGEWEDRERPAWLCACYGIRLAPEIEGLPPFFRNLTRQRDGVYSTPQRRWDDASRAGSGFPYVRPLFPVGDAVAETFPEDEDLAKRAGHVVLRLAVKRGADEVRVTLLRREPSGDRVVADGALRERVPAQKELRFGLVVTGSVVIERILLPARP